MFRKPVRSVERSVRFDCLKKEALTSADLKPLFERIKKLESGK